jgi:hypothetical protein
MFFGNSAQNLPFTKKPNKLEHYRGFPAGAGEMGGTGDAGGVCGTGGTVGRLGDPPPPLSGIG